MHFSQLPCFLAPPYVPARQRRAFALRHCVSSARHVQILKFPSTLFRRPNQGVGIHKASQQQTFRAYQYTPRPADRSPVLTPSRRCVTVLQTLCTGVWRADRHLLSVPVLIRIHTVPKFPLVPDRSTRSAPGSRSTRPHPRGHRMVICTSHCYERCNLLNRG